MIDVVGFCPGRNDEQREPGAKAATSVGVLCFWIDAGQSGGWVAALPCSVELIECSGGAVDDGASQMVVPAVRVVVGDDDSGVPPLRCLLDSVEDVDDESLLIERAGVSTVTVLVAGGFEDGDCGEVSCGNGVEEVVRVVLMICLTVGVRADGGDAFGRM